MSSRAGEVQGLLPNAIARFKKIIKNGKVAAQSWSQEDKLALILGKEEKFNKVVQDSNVEQWQLNAAVHYNEWANLDKNDFIPVVDAYKALVKSLTCPDCNSVLFVTPDVGSSESVTCHCGSCYFNLQSKH